MSIARHDLLFIFQKSLPCAQTPEIHILANFVLQISHETAEISSRAKKASR
jgi:hypothetical protein